MKKLVLLVTVLLSSMFAANAQGTNPFIGIVGDAAAGWPDATTNPDIELVYNAQTMKYELKNQDLKVGALKFRQDKEWANNWGGNALVGTSVPSNGADLKIVTAGKYDITFDLVNLKHSIAPAGVVPFSVSIMGTANNDFSFDLSSTDNNTFTGNGVDLLDGMLRITVSQGAETTVYEGAAFPEGTAVVATEGSIAVTAGKYDITFIKSTLEYFFRPAADPVKTISITGAAALGWGNDVQLTKNETTGLWELLNQALTVEEFKFRANGSYDINWGASGVAGQAQQGSDSNIAVVEAGNYDITFNRETAEYTLVLKTLSTNSFELNGTIVSYSNPAEGALNLSTAANVELYNVSGVLVAKKSNTTSVDVSGLTKGLYIAKINGQTAKIWVK